MNVVLLIAVVLAIFFQSIMQKQYNKRTSNQGSYIFNAFACLSAAAVFALTDQGGFVVPAALIPYIIGFAVTFALALLFIFLSIREGSLSFTCLLKSYSLLVPTFYGILFLNEIPGSWFWIGLVFFVISIFLINAKKDDTKFSLKWCIYILLACISNGAASTVQMLQQKQFDGQYKSEFMVCAILIGSIFFFILSLIQEKHIIKDCIKRGLIFMVLMGSLLGIANLFLMMLISSDMPTPIIYPVMSGGGVVLATLVSIIFYKEKITVAQKIGLVCGVVSIVFMNI